MSQLKIVLLLRPSVIILVLTNLVPIYAVLFLNWKLFPILLLFWLENVIVGLINVLKMLLVTPNDSAQWVVKLFFVPFFCFHYGIFTFVHGVFVFLFFGGVLSDSGSFPDAATVAQTILSYHIEWVVLGLVTSHGLSFALNYIGREEYKQTSLTQLMVQPYVRVAVLHITILVGGFLITLLNAPAIGLVVLVLFKIVLDVRSHLKQHNTK